VSVLRNAELRFAGNLRQSDADNVLRQIACPQQLFESHPAVNEILVATALLHLGCNNCGALRLGFANTPKVALDLRRNVIAPFLELRQE
jgi:hypothetical protein